MSKTDKKGKAKASYTSFDFLSAFRVEAEGAPCGMSVTVGGVRAVLSFSEKSVVLSAGKRRVEIVGEKLSVSTFEHRTVEVKGKVSEVIFGV